MIMTLLTYASVAFVLLANTASAQSISLDSTFNHTGKSLSYFGAISQPAASVIDAAGNIVMAGTASLDNFATREYFMLVRYRPNGSVDNTFGAGGMAVDSFGANIYNALSAIVLQPDGKIIAAGRTYNDTLTAFALERFTASGQPDSTFGINGKVITDFSGFSGISKLALQADGSIVAAGETNGQLSVVRYKINGSIDSTFGTNGIFIFSQAAFSESLVIQNDGEIIIGSSIDIVTISYALLLRLNTDGTLDNSFATGGLATLSIGAGQDLFNCIKLQADGKIVAGGPGHAGASFFSYGMIARYLNNGTLDSSFANNGIIVKDEPVGQAIYFKSLAIQADGKIVACGYYLDATNHMTLVLYRATAHGYDDNSVGVGGIILTPTDSAGMPCGNMGVDIDIQSDNKIVVTGAPSIDAMMPGLGRYFFSLFRYNTALEVGIDNVLSPAEEFSISPNPISDKGVLHFNIGTETAAEVVMTDVTGRNIAALMPKGAIRRGVYDLPLMFPDNIPAGVYIVTLKTTEGSKSVKVVK